MSKWSLLYPACVLLFVLSLTNSQSTSTAQTSDADQEVEASTPVGNARQEWIKLEQDLKKGVTKILKKAMPVVMKEVYKKEVSAPCLGALLSFVKALKDAKVWAYKILDSSGRFPEGFLQGTLTALGNYQECIDIEVNETKLKLQGQYCIVNLLPPMPVWKPLSSAHLTMPELKNVSASDTVISHILGIIHNLHVTTIKIGICTPSKCTPEDVDRLVDIIPEQMDISWRFQVSHCEMKKAVEFSDAQLIVLCTMGVIFLLVLTGTIVDKLYSSEDMEKSSLKSTLFHIAKSFSFTANAKKLADFTCPESELSFVYGIGVCLFCWIVMSDTFMYVNYDVASNFIHALELLKYIFYEVALNRIMPLQALFFFSGFVTTYRVMKSGKQLNVIKFILSKFWRYTPTYALLLGFLLLTPTWGSGPTWEKHMNPVYNRCKDNWWYNVLYINNFLGADKLCLNHTWIFAVVAQLHAIAICILLPLTIRPKIGLMVNFVLAIASLVSIALTNVHYDLPPNEMAAILHDKDRNFYAEHSYFRVYTHVNLYCVGVFVGYFLAKNRNFSLSTKMSAFLWLVTGTGISAALGVVHEWSQGEVPSPLLATLYATLSKIAEASFLSWVTVACMTGHAGGVEHILGWRPFIFFGRLTFIAYIMHVPILSMVMNFKKAPVFVCNLEIFYIVISHVVASYIISYALYMFFEAPWISLTEFLSRRCKNHTFNSKLSQEGPITEKPIKYSDKERIATTKCVNTLEKGHY